MITLHNQYPLGFGTMKCQITIFGSELGKMTRIIVADCYANLICFSKLCSNLCSGEGHASTFPKAVHSPNCITYVFRVRDILIGWCR
jgi:hypothetical protein